MAKPLFRWTCGPCLQQGLEVLAESIDRTTAALGLNNWDWIICYNGLTKEGVRFITDAIGKRPIFMFNQNWSTAPVGDNMQTPMRKDGSFEWNGTKCGGTMWKVCPPRLRMETHEIVMDNDVVMLKKFPQIDEWLKHTDKMLILEEPIRFYGRYDCLFGPEPPFINSGFMGFPPGYDFGAVILEQWNKHGKYMNLSQADEQGLLMYCLSRSPSLRISNTQMIEILAKDYNYEVKGEEFAFHFTQSNRIQNHVAWTKYKTFFERK